MSKIWLNLRYFHTGKREGIIVFPCEIHVTHIFDMCVNHNFDKFRDFVKICRFHNFCMSHTPEIFRDMSIFNEKTCYLQLTTPITHG